MLTRAMALESAKYHVRVNAIMPGTIRTDLGGWYETEEAQIYLEQRVPWADSEPPNEVAGSDARNLPQQSGGRAINGRRRPGY